MILAAHQSNFIPWLPYFDKMNKADVFVIMVNCQFEKNGWQNRCEVNDTKWTMPVQRGNKDIKDKLYTNGLHLANLNIHWIHSIAMTLGIDTSKIKIDFPTQHSATDRLIELCKHYECDQYLTNPEAKQKYLVEKDMNNEGIEVVSHNFDHKIHVFEAFETFGIEGTVKLLKRSKEKV